MLPNAKMVPKECGFNQTETACLAWRFPCSPARWWAYKNAAFLSSRRHNSPSKLMLRNNQTVTNSWLHVDAPIIRSFQKELFSFFLPVSYAGHVGLAAAKPWWFMSKWKDGSTVEFIMFIVFKISFLPKYRVNYYDYIVNWRSLINCNWCVLPKC